VSRSNRTAMKGGSFDGEQDVRGKGQEATRGDEEVFGISRGRPEEEGSDSSREPEEPPTNSSIPPELLEELRARIRSAIRDEEY